MAWIIGWDLLLEFILGASVVVKVAICLFVIVAGAFFIKKANLTPFIPPSKPTTGGTGSGLEQPVIQTFLGNPASFGIAGILTAAAVVFFAYTGFEAVANMSEESRNPRRDMPRGLLWTLGIATALYLGVSFVLTGMSKYTDLNEGPRWHRRSTRSVRRGPAPLSPSPPSAGCRQ